MGNWSQIRKVGTLRRQKLQSVLPTNAAAKTNRATIHTCLHPQREVSADDVISEIQHCSQDNLTSDQISTKTRVYQD